MIHFCREKKGQTRDRTRDSLNLQVRCRYAIQPTDEGLLNFNNFQGLTALG